MCLQPAITHTHNGVSVFSLSLSLFLYYILLCQCYMTARRLRKCVHCCCCYCWCCCCWWPGFDMRCGLIYTDCTRMTNDTEDIVNLLNSLRYFLTANCILFLFDSVVFSLTWTQWLLLLWCQTTTIPYSGICSKTKYLLGIPVIRCRWKTRTLWESKPSFAYRMLIDENEAPTQTSQRATGSRLRYRC